MEPVNKTFDKCPACGSSARFFETLGNNMKERGLTRPKWLMAYDAKSGVVVDKLTEERIPFGSDVPAFSIFTDICLDCGCVYATMLAAHMVQKQLEVARGNGLPPRLNNPMTS
jgi:hypothetical protein